MQADTKNKLVAFLLVAGLITAFLFFLDIAIGPKYGGDIEWYISAAQGHLSGLIQPYSARFLHPFIVGLIDRNLPIDVYRAFALVSVASMFLFLLISANVLKDTVKKPLLLLPLFISPFFFDALRYIFHPDAFYILLTALFFLALFHKKESWSLIILFLLFLTRESTMLLGLVFAGVSWVNSKKLLTTAIIGVIAISFFTTSFISSIGQSNKHHLSGSAYLVSKLSYNFATNVFGIIPWANTSENCAPILKVALPHLKSLGNIKEAGICGFDFSLPLKTLITLLTIFGIAPLVLANILKNHKDVWKKIPFWASLALIYGLAHYFIGIAAGTGVQRLVGYGWPAFLLVTPFLLNKFFELDKKFIIKLSLIQIFVAWLPLVVERTLGDTIIGGVFVILVTLAFYLYTFQILRENKKELIYAQNEN